MKYSIQQYAQALYESLQDTAAKDYDKVIDNFIEVLKTNQDLPKYEQIIESYAQLDREQRGVTKASITTAQEIKIDKTIMDTLNDLAGIKLEMQQSVDESLVGGVVVRIDDTLIDGSVKGQLKKLKKTLSN